MTEEKVKRLFKKFKDMKIIQENIQRLTISKDYIIKLDNGELLHINKFLEEAPDDIGESEWSFISPESRKIYESLDDDKKDKINDFIDDIEINNS
jgi:hypothetical protein